MTINQRVIKRTFDIVGSLLGLLLTWWVILVAYVVVVLTSKGDGIYKQIRVGKDGKQFRVLKIRSMQECSTIVTSVTTHDDLRMTSVGRHIRRWKIDELPQLMNVFIGQMSFVGPRPDVPGFADCLTGEDRVILSVRPGITGPATLKFRHEEVLLSGRPDPEKYNREVIWPQKVRINRAYVREYSFWKDMDYLWQTLFPR